MSWFVYSSNLAPIQQKRKKGFVLEAIVPTISNQVMEILKWAVLFTSWNLTAPIQQNQKDFCSMEAVRQSQIKSLDMELLLSTPMKRDC